MHPLDWFIVALLMVCTTVIALYANRYLQSVSDFLAGSRCAKRYLITVSEGAAAFAVISMIAAWEMYYKAGFSVLWWQEILPAVIMLLALSGWVTYRYRQTRVMTMAQFFEVRYSRNFRIYCGLLAWLAGIVNYGIFPAVTARCLIYFCGIPVYFLHLGSVEINLTIAVVMAVMIGLALLYTLLGGQITIMVSDWFQWQIFSLAFLAVFCVLITKVHWTDVVETLKLAPRDQSMLNPFAGGKVADFNIWFFLMSAFLQCYGFKAWQGTQGFNCAAKTPHEARMAGILAGWRDFVLRIILVFTPICAYAILHNPKFSVLAQVIHDALVAIADEKVRDQMTVSLALKNLLPVGLIGFMAAAMVAAAVSTDNTCLHSWGSIFIQDVVMPFRKTQLSNQQHLRWLRYSVIGVAIFAWTFSMIFPLKEYIYMFVNITGAIYIGGAGSAIIGGLYWKRGTTPAAWTAMILGSVLAVLGILLNNVFWPNILPQLKTAYPRLVWLQHLPVQTPLNGMEMAFITALICMMAYVIVSLLTKPDPDFNMDKMLHRGPYALTDDVRLSPQKKSLINYFGITSEFTKWDKVIYFTSMGMSLFWFSAFVIGSILYRIFGASDDTWAKWWFFKLSTISILALGVTIWFLIGGVYNLFDLFRTLKAVKRNALDDGAVAGHQNVADLHDAPPESSEPQSQKT